MFRKWQLPPQFGTGLFPNTIIAPPIMRVKMQLPRPRSDYDTETKSLEALALETLNRERGNVVSFYLAQRQNAHIGGRAYARTRSRRFKQVEATYTYANGLDQLDVVVHPQPPLKVKKEEGKCLLIFHDTNKITAVLMRDLESFTGQGELRSEYAKSLAQGSWEEDPIRVSQFLFTKADGGLVLSALKADDQGVITKSETHELTLVREGNAFRTFFSTSTLSNRTPFINGGDGVYYVARDKFTVGSSGLVYEGGDGYDNDVSAISADGTRYYKPNVLLPNALAVSSTDPFEVLALHNAVTAEQVSTQKDEWDTRLYEGAIFAAPHMVNTEGILQPGGEWTMYVFPDELSPIIGSGGYNFFETAPPQFQLGGEFAQDGIGGAGYGVWTSEEGYTPVFKLIADLDDDHPVNEPPYSADMSMDFPCLVFSQVDGQDVLAVEFTFVAMHEYNRRFDSTSTQNFLSDFSIFDYSFVQNIYLDDSGFDPVFTDQGSTPLYPPAPIFENITSQAWLVTFPPHLSLDDEQRYFADTGTLQTPYGTYPYVQSGDSDGTVHAFAMHEVYVPWLHLSNGKLYLQGFEIDGDRRVFYTPPEANNGRPDPIDLTDALAQVAQTEITNIQAMWLDVPLERIKQLV